MTIEHLEILLHRYAACLSEQRLLRDANRAALERRLARESEHSGGECPLESVAALGRESGDQPAARLNRARSQGVSTVTAVS
jgi:hypothetical protein